MYHINYKLPLQYVQIDERNYLYSRISNKICQDPEYGSIQAIKNPFCEDKIIFVAFGLDRKGTANAIGVLKGLLNRTIGQPEKYFGNTSPIQANNPYKVYYY